MIRELDVVVLRKDPHHSSLKAGDIGTVVQVYGNQEGFEIDFVTADGGAIDVMTLLRDDIEPLAGRPLETRRVGTSSISHIAQRSAA